MAPPVSNNWGFINDPEFDKLVAAVRVAFDPAERDKALAALHERSVDEAAFLWVAHDVGPRAHERRRSRTSCSRRAGSSTSRR